MSFHILQNRSRGFTLIEVLLAMAIAVILMSAVLSAVMAGFKASSSIEQHIAVQQDVRAALDLMAAEIEMASFNRVAAFNNQWADLNCALCSGLNCTLRKGIPLANASQLMVAMNTTENTCIGPLCAVTADANEIITYTYQSNNRITRNVNCGGAVDFIGGDPSNSALSLRQRNVTVINSELGIPMFQYYDGAGNELTAVPLAAADTANVQRIKITIAVRSLLADFEGKFRVMTETTSVLPRNHRISIL